MFSEEQRKGWLSPDHVLEGLEVTIAETQAGGEARLTLTSANRLLSVKTTGDSAARWLKQRQVADGTVVEFKSESEVVVHIVECKRTIKLSSWEKIQKQFEGAIQNAFAVLGVLGRSHQITTFRLYTAYRHNKLKQSQLTNPTLIKQPLGQRAMPDAAQEWSSGSLSIMGQPLEHSKVTLDEHSEATMSLDR